MSKHILNIAVFTIFFLAIVALFIGSSPAIAQEEGEKADDDRPLDKNNITHWINNTELPQEVLGGAALLFSGDEESSGTSDQRESDKETDINLAPDDSVEDRNLGDGTRDFKQVTTAVNSDRVFIRPPSSLTSEWNSFINNEWDAQAEGRGGDNSFSMFSMNANISNYTVNGSTVIEGHHVTYISSTSSVIAHADSHPLWRGLYNNGGKVGTINPWFTKAGPINGTYEEEPQSYPGAKEGSGYVWALKYGGRISRECTNCYKYQGFDEGYVPWSDVTYRMLKPEGTMRFAFDSLVNSTPGGYSPTENCKDPDLENAKDNCALGARWVLYDEVEVERGMTNLTATTEFRLYKESSEIDTDGTIQNTRIREDKVGRSIKITEVDGNNITILYNGDLDPEFTTEEKEITVTNAEVRPHEDGGAVITGEREVLLDRKPVKDGIVEFEYDFTEDWQHQGLSNWTAQGQENLTVTHPLELTYKGNVLKKYNVSKLCEQGELFRDGQTLPGGCDNVEDDERAWLTPRGVSEDATKVETKDSTNISRNYTFYIERRFTDMEERYQERWADSQTLQKLEDIPSSFKPTARIAEYPNGTSEVIVRDIRAPRDYETYDAGPEKQPVVRKTSELPRLWRSVETDRNVVLDKKTIEFNLSKQEVTKEITFERNDDIAREYSGFKPVGTDVYVRAPYKKGGYGSLYMYTNLDSEGSRLLTFYDTLGKGSSPIRIGENPQEFGCDHNESKARAFDNTTSYVAQPCDDYPRFGVGSAGNITFEFTYHGDKLNVENPVKGQATVIRRGVRDTKERDTTIEANASVGEYERPKSELNNNEVNINSGATIDSQWGYFTGRNRAFDSFFYFYEGDDWPGETVNAHDVEQQSVRSSIVRPVYTHAYPNNRTTRDTGEVISDIGLTGEDTREKLFSGEIERGEELADIEQQERFVTNIRGIGRVKILSEKLGGRSVPPPFLMSHPHCLDWNGIFTRPHTVNSEVVQREAYGQAITGQMRQGRSEDAGIGRYDEELDRNDKPENNARDIIDRCSYNVGVHTKTLQLNDRENFVTSGGFTYRTDRPVNTVVLNGLLPRQKTDANVTERVSIYESRIDGVILDEDSEDNTLRVQINLTNKFGEPIDLQSRQGINEGDAPYNNELRGRIQIECENSGCTVLSNGIPINKAVTTDENGTVNVSIRDSGGEVRVKYVPYHWDTIETDEFRAYDGDSSVIRSPTEEAAAPLETGPLLPVAIILLVLGILFYYIMRASGEQVNSWLSLYRPILGLIPKWTWLILLLGLLFIAAQQIGVF